MAFKRCSLVFLFCLWMFCSFTLCKEEEKEESLLNNIKDKILGHKEEVPPSTLEKIQTEALNIAEKLQEIPQVIKDSVMGSNDNDKKDKESIAEVIIDTAGQIKEKLEDAAAAVNNIAAAVQQKYEENAPKTSYENIKEAIKEKMTQNHDSDSDKKKEKEEKEKKEKKEKEEKEKKEKKEKEDKEKEEKEKKEKKEKEDKEKKDKKEKEDKEKKEKEKKEKEKKEKEDKEKKGKEEKSTFEKLKELLYFYQGKQNTTKDEGITSKIMSFIQNGYNALRLKMGL